MAPPFCSPAYLACARFTYAWVRGAGGAGARNVLARVSGRVALLATLAVGVGVAGDLRAGKNKPCIAYWPRRVDNSCMEI